MNVWDSNVDRRQTPNSEVQYRWEEYMKIQFRGIRLTLSHFHENIFCFCAGGNERVSIHMEILLRISEGTDFIKMKYRRNCEAPA